MKDENGRKVYVTYKFSSEEEKHIFESMPLEGKRFLVEGEMVEPEKTPTSPIVLI